MSAGLYGISEAFSTTTLSTDGTTAEVGDLFNPDFLNPPGAQLDAGSIVGSSGNYAREITTPLLGVDQIAGVGSATSSLLAMQWKFDESHLPPAVRKYNQFLRDTGLMNDPIPIGPGAMKGPIGNVSRKFTEAAMKKFNQTMGKWFRRYSKSGNTKTILKLRKGKIRLEKHMKHSPKKGARYSNGSKVSGAVEKPWHLHIGNKQIKLNPWNSNWKFFE